MAVAGAVYPSLHERPVKNTILLFDVDGTLTLARRDVSPSMLSLLTRLRHHVAIGYVGGSDLRKQQEQLGAPAGLPVTSLFDFCFPENGLTAFRMGSPLTSATFITWLGEDKYKQLIKWVLHYIADLDIPVKRGTFVEFRNGMINVSPVGRNASQEERDAYQTYDLEHGIRDKMVKAMQEKFADFGLTYSIGGQISFDVFPMGWDKTFCLTHVEAEAEREGAEAVKFDKIHFFGDKTFKGGNDFEIYEDKRTIGHSVENPEQTEALLKEMFPVLTQAA